MARNLARIPSIDIEPQTPASIVALVNTRIAEINRVLTEVEAEINQQKGNDGAVPVFNAEINMREHRITNSARSRDPKDAVIRQELIDLGLIGNADGTITFGSPVEFSNTVSLTGPGGGSSSPSSVESVTEAIATALGENVATSNAGEPLENEQADGTDGTTPGTVAMARDQNGKAQYLTVRNGRLQVDTENLETLVTELIHAIKELNHVLGH